MRRFRVVLLCAATLLLASCGGSTAAKTGPTATTGGPATTRTPIPTATTHAATGACGLSTMLPSDGHITQSGPLMMQVKPNLLSAQGQYRLPESVGQAPIIVRTFQTASDQYPVVVNATSYVFTICNTGSQPLTLSGITVELTKLSPLAAPIPWADPCHSTYRRPTGVHEGGCGGGIGAEIMGTATFAGSAQAGATAPLVNDLATLPVVLPSDHGTGGTATIAGLSAPGTYTFTLRFALGATTATLVTAPMPAHLPNKPWTGDTCTSTTMQSQIPASSTDPWLCPPA